MNSTVISVRKVVSVGCCKMTAKHILSLSNAEFKNFIDSIDVVLSDCDGEWLFTINNFYKKLLKYLIIKR